MTLLSMNQFCLKTAAESEEDGKGKKKSAGGKADALEGEDPPALETIEEVHQVNDEDEIDDANGNNENKDNNDVDKDAKEMSADEEVNEAQSKFGRSLNQPSKLNHSELAGLLSDDVGSTPAEAKHHDAMREIDCLSVACDGNLFDPFDMCDAEFGFVGATGTSFTSAAEPNVVKCNEARKKDPKNWSVAIDREHDGMVVDHEVFKGVPRDEVPDGKLVASSTWAMKQKPSGEKHARVSARGLF